MNSLRCDLYGTEFQGGAESRVDVFVIAERCLHRAKAFFASHILIVTHV